MSKGHYPNNVQQLIISYAKCCYLQEGLGQVLARTSSVWSCQNQYACQIHTSHSHIHSVNSWPNYAQAEA